MTTPHYWDKALDNSQCRFANGAGGKAKQLNSSWTVADCDDGYAYTAPVANYRPNPFNLYDMLGNTREWTADCWPGSYANAPVDGSAWLDAGGGDCKSRVVRGGSWYGGPRSLRSAFRNWFASDVAGNGLGFRLARAL
ncbi:MAG: formylglycine-generating enzyme family protein [Proteobacteria bacterium]|nr:formylglycine-generating enzyme family protein [Pseudomonadota bacterium]